ncbi:non-specific lipid transfer protein GPI-anchored 10-like [Diospyros lotus]|uniref:non-specific lipid transfer protein GPI-anchored 10-like n=1 Tax=Diospyros lotus TaxID=55363 RepID=UPI00224EAA09|nr:non-specific lipid transfer protein GPI-anchored 10-like [Diospyros lotus]
MASLPYPSTLLVFSILLAWFPNPIVPQSPAAAAAGTTLGSPPAATLAECETSLLQLASCIPFVQGAVPLPSQPCCGGLKQLYDQQPGCFCLLLLNATVFGPFPINSTLAFQLPPLCGLQPDFSACSGVPPPPPAASNQVSFGTKPNSTAAPGSPAVTMTPSPAVVGFGLGHSGGAKLETAASAAAVTSVVWRMVYSYL